MAVSYTHLDVYKRQNKDAVPDFKKHFFDLLDKEGISGEL